MVAVGPNVVKSSTRERLEQWGLSKYPSPALPVRLSSAPEMGAGGSCSDALL
jgi:hypothetical protein